MIRARDYFSDLPQTMTECMQTVRQALPLPEEIPAEQLKQKGSELLVAIRTTSAGSRLRVRTDLLSGLFDAYAATDVPAEQAALDALVDKASNWSLFRLGWQVFQRRFPDESVRLALHRMYQQLKSSDNRPSGLQHLLVDYIPLSLNCQDMLSETAVALQLFCQTQPAAAAAAPANRHMTAFFRPYLIDPQEAFGGRLLSAHVKHLSDTDLQEQQRFILSVLANLDPPSATLLMSRVIRSGELTRRQRGSYYQAFAHHWQPHTRTGRAVLAALHPSERRSYCSWLAVYNLRRHFRINLVKRDFLLNYSVAMIDTGFITPTILAVHFPHFILIDDLNQEDDAWIYGKKRLRQLLQAGIKGSRLADPRLPEEEIDSVMATGKVRGPLKLSFVGSGFRRTTQLFDRLLGGTDVLHNPDLLQNWLSNS
jgi:hypothetical protein